MCAATKNVVRNRRVRTEQARTFVAVWKDIAACRTARRRNRIHQHVARLSLRRKRDRHTVSISANFQLTPGQHCYNKHESSVHARDEAKMAEIRNRIVTNEFPKIVKYLERAGNFKTNKYDSSSWKKRSCARNRTRARPTAIPSSFALFLHAKPGTAHKSQQYCLHPTIKISKQNLLIKALPVATSFHFNARGLRRRR